MKLQTSKGSNACKLFGVKENVYELFHLFRYFSKTYHQPMKYFVFFSFVFISFQSYSQTYISLAPSLTNTAGTIFDKSNIALELGQQWDVFSLGIDIGKTTLSKVTGRDTSAYIELRPNLNVFQQGKFTNTFTAGIGFVFNARQGLVTELSNGIEYAFNNKLHFNIVFGQYFYSGRSASDNNTFFGISAAYYFNETNVGSIIKKQSQ